MNNELCLSSFLFLIPIMYAIYHNETPCCFIISGTAICSFIHHYTNQMNSIYHTIDIVVSRSSFVLLQLHYINVTNNVIFSFYSMNFISLTYQISCIQYKLSLIKNDRIWIYYHIYFHLCVMFTMLLGISDISTIRAERKC